MMAPLETGRRTLTTAGAAFATLQMTWRQVRAQASPLGSGEDNTKGNVGDDEPADALGEEGVGGGEVESAAPASTAVADAKDPNAEDLVAEETSSPPTELVIPQDGNEGQEATNPVKAPTSDLDNATEDQKTPVPTESTQKPKLPMTETPTEPLPQTTEPAAVVEATTKPSLRTQDPVVISDTVTNDTAGTHGPGYLSQGTNPLVLIALAGICCIFLLVWGRKRRSSASASSGTSVGAAGPKGPKVQYTQVPDEQPFSHSQNDDDEYCDDYEEDSFANDRDNWDDWEGNSTQTQVPELNPFAAAPSAPRPATPRQNSNSPSPFKLSQPLPPPPQQQHHVQLQEIAIAGKGDLLHPNVESNSSSDSFEVVTEEAHMPPISSRGTAADAEKEAESVDDLFSQFGMVPTFKKSVVVPPPPAASSAAHASEPATPSSVSSLPTAAEASALFAAEMDDELTAVDAADEWGEDDEWVKGI